MFFNYLKCYTSSSRPYINVLQADDHLSIIQCLYEGHTESHEQLFFACELGTADEGECGGRWNQLLYYP